MIRGKISQTPARVPRDLALQAQQVGHSLAHHLQTLAQQVAHRLGPLLRPGGDHDAALSGLEADVDMLDAALSFTRDFGSVRMRALARGHWLPGDLESTAGRPGGYRHPAR